MQTTETIGIIAYTYDAEYHCVDCTRTRFNRDTLNAFYPDRLNDSNGIPTNPNGSQGSYGLIELVDSEGNLVHPVFNIDEWMELDEGHLSENPTQHLTCGDCHKIIETYEHQG